MSIKVGDKFIIEIGAIAELPDGKKKYFIKPFESLVFDRKGLEQLEKCNKTWEEELDKQRKQAYIKGYYDARAKYLHPSANDNYEKDEDEIYNKGLEDARQILLELFEIPSGERGAIFDETSYYVEAILRNYSLGEISEKIRAYKETKKVRNSIIKGDTVCFRANPDTTFVVWDMCNADDDILLYGFNQENTYGHVSIKDVKKVNAPNCYSEINQILNKIDGE